MLYLHNIWKSVLYNTFNFDCQSSKKVKFFCCECANSSNSKCQHEVGSSHQLVTIQESAERGGAAHLWSSAFRFNSSAILRNSSTTFLICGSCCSSGLPPRSSELTCWVGSTAFMCLITYLQRQKKGTTLLHKDVPRFINCSHSQ